MWKSENKNALEEYYAAGENLLSQLLRIEGDQGRFCCNDGAYVCVSSADPNDDVLRDAAFLQQRLSPSKRKQASAPKQGESYSSCSAVLAATPRSFAHPELRQRKSELVPLLKSAVSR